MSNTDDDDADAAVSSAALYAALAPVYDRWQALDGNRPFWELVLGQLEPVLRRRRAPVTLFVFDVTNALGFRRWWTGNRTWRDGTSVDAWQVQVEMAFRPAASAV